MEAKAVDTSSHDEYAVNCVMRCWSPAVRAGLRLERMPVGRHKVSGRP